MHIILETKNLQKHYQTGAVTIQALRSVDFQVRLGEFVAIMGPSGSGKSTLLHLLGGLDAATRGEIRLDGKSLTQMDDDTLTITRRRDIGFIFQFYNLMPTLTAAENVALPLLMDGKKSSDFQHKVTELLALVGLSDRADHKPSQLSGGQQQRVAIARALVTAPKLVLADEPTGNLDSAAGQTILQLLRRTCDEQQQTIVMVTHDNRAAAIADRVVFLKDGQIVRELPLDRSTNARHTQTVAAVAAETGI